MKQFINAFVSYSRVERLGLAVLSILLMLLLFLRFAMHLWVHPPEMDAAQQARMNAAYIAWKERSAGSNPTGVAASDGSLETTLFPFDPNTLDSAGFVRLGMPVKAVRSLLNWRSHNKHFYKAEDLKPLYNLPEDVYARLAPYIRIEENGPYTSQTSFASTNSFPAIPSIIDLNTADSATLDRGVPGIGATLAHKIIQRRIALGGFIRHEQLLEVYKFPDSTFQNMKGKLRINPNAIKKMDLNSATLAQLSAHPYIGEKTAKNILLFREGVKRYETIEQLRQVPLMNEEIYRKIAPYFRVGTSD